MNEGSSKHEQVAGRLGMKRAIGDRSPLVSIIICVYNAGQYLDDAIASALGQTHENIEVLLIDDGSTDGAVDRVRERVKDSRLRWFHQENAGKPRALNLALKEMRGEFYAILDADDTSKPTRIAKQLACFMDNPDIAAVYCGHEIILDEKHMAPRFRAKSRDQCRADIEAFRMPAHDPTGVYRVEFVQGLRYDESLLVAQGYDYILRIGEQFPMLVVGETLYGYRIHKQSVTKRDPGRRERLVGQVLKSACQRRGLNYERLFPELSQSKGKNRVADNNVASDFVESAIDLRRAGRIVEAMRTGIACVGMHPMDPHYYKAIVYALVPSGWTASMRAKRDQRRRIQMLAKE